MLHILKLSQAIGFIPKENTHDISALEKDIAEIPKQKKVVLKKYL